jgi:outer membrane protein assembly factor BamD
MWGRKADPTKGWSAQQLYSSAKARLESGDYETAIDYYGKLESRYPFGPLAQQAQLETAYAYYKSDEPASAIAAADRFLRMHPRHSSADYAYYLKGLANFNRGRNVLDVVLPQDPSARDPGAAAQAFRDFEELVRQYPDSRYAADATQRMVYLKNTVAQHEIHVARYYLRRAAYVAAANRARYVVERFQGTPSVPEALVIMATAYRVLGLEDLSADALRVLELNFPNHPGVESVRGLRIE